MKKIKNKKKYIKDSSNSVYLPVVRVGQRQNIYWRLKNAISIVVNH